MIGPKLGATALAMTAVVLGGCPSPLCYATSLDGMCTVTQLGGDAGSAITPTLGTFTPADGGASLPNVVFYLQPSSCLAASHITVGPSFPCTYPSWNHSDCGPRASNIFTTGGLADDAGCR